VCGVQVPLDPTDQAHGACISSAGAQVQRVYCAIRAHATASYGSAYFLTGQLSLFSTDFAFVEHVIQSLSPPQVQSPPLPREDKAISQESQAFEDSAASTPVPLRTPTPPPPIPVASADSTVVSAAVSLPLDLVPEETFGFEDSSDEVESTEEVEANEAAAKATDQDAVVIDSQNIQTDVSHQNQQVHNETNALPTPPPTDQPKKRLPYQPVRCTSCRFSRFASHCHDVLINLLLQVVLCRVILVNCFGCPSIRL
jgi:hypothetical protein